jgi:hypothetical protein
MFTRTLLSRSVQPKSIPSSVPGDIRARRIASRVSTFIAIALLAFATHASAQDVFSSGSGSEGGGGQSCEQTYDDTTRQIAEARALIYANFKKQEIDCNGDP